MSTRTAVTCTPADLDALVHEHVFGKCAHVWSAIPDAEMLARARAEFEEEYDVPPPPKWVPMFGDSGVRCDKCGEEAIFGGRSLGPRGGCSEKYSRSWEGMRLVMEQVQHDEPGWRFGLIGGDISYATFIRAGEYTIDRTRMHAFGWHAEFFGTIDPETNTGQRHGQAYASTAPVAVCLAALAAKGIDVTLEPE